MTTRNTFPRQSFGNNVLESVAGSNASNATVSVLSVMLWSSDFRSPMVSITKAKIRRMTGLSVKTIKASLRWLRQNGVLVCISGEMGGNGISTTYEIHEYQKGGSDWPPKKWIPENGNGGNSRPKGGKSRTQRGVATSPQPTSFIPLGGASPENLGFDDSDVDGQGTISETKVNAEKREFAEKTMREAGFELNEYGGIVPKDEC